MFGEIISTYTRTQAIEDGVLVDVSEMASEAGIKFPVAVTNRLYHEVLTPDSRAIGQSVEGRTWDALWMLSRACRRSQGGSEVQFEVLFIMKRALRRRKRLRAVVGPHGPRDPRPCITLMLADES